MPTPFSISNAGNFNWSNPLNIRGEKGGGEQNLNLTDANGTPTARIHHYVNSNNLRSIVYLEAYNKKTTDGSTVSATIIAVANVDGTSYALAPTTPSNATSNEIATADWVNGKLANRVQKLTLKGTLISNGNIIIEPADIQPNDTVTIAITASSIGSTAPITFVMDIPSTVETATSVRSSSHIVKGSDGKVYSISLFGMYQQTVGWEITIPKLSIADGAISSLAITSFYGHILRSG